MTKIMMMAIAAASISSIAVSKEVDNLPDPKLTEEWKEVTKVDTMKQAPSDALILLDGSDLSQFQHGDGSAVKWTLTDGAMTVNPGTKGIQTKEKFCDAQIHIEWRSPPQLKHRTGQHDGNSGIYIQGRYEVQVLNSYNNDTYANGQAGAIYKQTPPLVNATKPVMEWQAYDIIFKAPTFKNNGALDTKAAITVLHNGVVIQNHTIIDGGTTYRGAPSYKAHGCAPIHLQDHGSLVSYRNIWVRKL